VQLDVDGSFLKLQAEEVMSKVRVLSGHGKARFILTSDGSANLDVSRPHFAGWETTTQARC